MEAPAARTWLCGSPLARALSGATAGWAAAPGGPMRVTESRSVADDDLGCRDGYYRVRQARRQVTDSTPASDDYVRGYGDGLNGKDDRDRDGGYRTGYRAGHARFEANSALPDGRLTDVGNTNCT